MKARPCRSFNRAYVRAGPGDIVQVAGGSYPGQRIYATPMARGPRILFRPAPGAAVTVESIRVTRGSYIEFRGFRVTTDTYNDPGARRITYRWIKMRQFFIRGADYVSYVGSNVGPNVSNDGMNWITAAYGTTNGASHILLHRVRIHGFVKHNAGAHVDCIGIDDVNWLTIRRSRFWNCEHFALIFGKDLSSNRAARNVLLENNFVDCCVSGFYSIGLGDVEGPMRIRFNSFTLGLGWLGGTVRRVILSSNILANNSSANCPKAIWRNNVVASGSACGGLRARTGFVRPPLNLHLRPGAPAINRGNRSSHPARDIDGQWRGSRPDAGADEFR
jgi:hypothetical protein